MALSPGGVERYIGAVLPSENAFRVGDLARALSVAWRYMAAYPPGHPSLTAALADAHARLREAAALSGSVSFGVSRDALILADERIDSSHAQKLAESLYRRDVAVVQFDRDVEPAELEALFREITGDPQKATLPLWDSLAAAGVSHIRITPVDFSGIRAAGMDPDAGIVEPASILEEIVRALMTGREISPDGTDLRQSEALSADGLASMLAKMIEAEASESASAPGLSSGEALTGSGRSGDIVDALCEKVLVQLNRPADERRRVSAHQIAELLRGLPPAVRERVLLAAIRVLSADPTAEEELRALSRILEPDEILHALTSIRLDGGALSGHALRLLQSLMLLSTAGQRSAKSDRDEIERLTEEISRILASEDIDRYNPPEHKELIAAMNIDIAPIEEGDRQRMLELGPERLATIEEDTLSRHVRLALLELLASRAGTENFEGILQRLESQFLLLLGTMQMGEAIALVDRIHALSTDSTVSEPVRKAASASIQRMAGGDSIQVLVDWLHLAADDLIPQIRRILDLLGSSGARNLLYALAEEKDRSRRRRLFDFLAAMGPVIVPEAIALLSDSRWYVARNMVALLRTVRDKRAIPEIRRMTTHEDIRVRLEAIKTLLGFERHMTQELLEKAIADPDPKVAETAITLCGSYGIVEARGPLVRLVTSRDWWGRRRNLRLKALRALAELGRPDTLDDLEPVLRERWWFPVAAPEERRLAYELLEFYPPEARAAWVERGLRSRDAAIRESANRLASSTAVAKKEEAG